MKPFRKTDLRPEMMKYIKILPVVGAFMIIISPVLMPIMVIQNNFKAISGDIMEFYSECFRCFIKVEE